MSSCRRRRVVVTVSSPSSSWRLCVRQPPIRRLRGRTGASVAVDVRRWSVGSKDGVFVE
eukprot:gene30668-37605_t